MVVAEDAASATASRAAAGRRALWAASPLWLDGHQERRQPEALEPVHGPSADAADGALHCRGGTYTAGAAGRMASRVRSCKCTMTLVAVSGRTIAVPPFSACVPLGLES